jgi:hypothetical protein
MRIYFYKNTLKHFKKHNYRKLFYFMHYRFSIKETFYCIFARKSFLNINRLVHDKKQIKT